jgi:hypothetical protein
VNDADSLIGVPEHAQQFPRSSTVIDHVIAVKGAILHWAIGMVQDGQDPIAYMNVKGDRGTLLHTHIEQVINGVYGIDKVEPMHRPFVEGAVDLCRGDMEVEQEIRRWSDTLKVRGTPDYVAVRPDGKRVMRDWKSGRESRTHAIQLHIYKFMYEERTGKTIDAMEDVYLRKRQPKVVPVEFVPGLAEAVCLLYHNLED